MLGERGEAGQGFSSTTLGPTLSLSTEQDGTRLLGVVPLRVTRVRVAAAGGPDVVEPVERGSRAA